MFPMEYSDLSPPLAVFPAVPTFHVILFLRCRSLRTRSLFPATLWPTSPPLSLFPQVFEHRLCFAQRCQAWLQRSLAVIRVLFGCTGRFCGVWGLVAASRMLLFLWASFKHSFCLCLPSHSRNKDLQLCCARNGDTTATNDDVIFPEPMHAAV